MKAVMLAAGIGARLGGSGARNAPKVLLRFGGRSLLQRHIDSLKRHGIEELVLGVGFNREEIERANAEVLPRTPAAAHLGRGAMMAGGETGRAPGYR